MTDSGVFGTGLTFEGTMDALEGFRITGPYEMDTALSKFIDLVRCSKSSRFTVLELSTCNTSYHLLTTLFCRKRKKRPDRGSNPGLPHLRAGRSATELPSQLLEESPTPTCSHFRHLRSFKVDLAAMKETPDILTQFKRLKHHYAYRLQLHLCSKTVHLPLHRTFKHHSRKSTSAQWMQGRSISKLFERTIIWPHLPATLLSRDPVNLPVCVLSICDNHSLHLLIAFNLPSVDELVVLNEAWDKPRSSQRLGFIWV